MSGAWRWALAVWARPGVEAICLDLQNRHGQCPPLLLWRLWAVEQRRPLSPDTLDAATRTTRTCLVTVIEPLRSARRALATPVEVLDDGGRIALRDQVRKAELAAERLLIEALETLASLVQTGRDDPVEALLGVVSAWGGVPPIDRLSALAEAVASGSD